MEFEYSKKTKMYMEQLTDRKSTRLNSSHAD